MTVTYSTYLKIDELLSLQEPLSDGPEHDETLFIVVHQVYELWFKQLLHEMTALQPALESGDRATSARGFKRALAILKTLVIQVDVIETMSPVSFSSFRTRLQSSSGFQSLQFHSLEFVLGHRGPERLEKLPTEHHAALEAISARPSLYDSFLRFLRHRGYDVPREVLERDFSGPNPESGQVRDALVEIYRSDADVAQVCESMVDLDEGLQEWRYRHVKMVERTIGTKTGTGGSSGAAYLRGTLFRPLFPDLWAIRARL